MLLSLCYLVVRGVLQLATLRCCSDNFKELEIIVLRHEPAILRRRTRRPVMTTVDRLFLAAASRLTGDTIWLRRLYVLFFIELGSRRVHLAGCTANPNDVWVTQQARQLTWALAERQEPVRFLIRDRDQKFTDGFDEVFRSDGVESVRTPFRARQANGVAERFVRTVRSECLDCLLILNAQHLEQILRVFINHYNSHRPQRALQLNPPEPTRLPVARAMAWDATHVQRRDRLGGVVHEYALAA